MQKVAGLNSIPNRFALLCGSITTLIVIMASFHTPKDGGSSLTTTIFMISLILLPTLITFFAARKLARQIVKLKNSTDIIAQGKLNHPIEVDCEFEVGGLADSFRGLVRRINASIIRMNKLAYSDSVTKLPNRTIIGHVLNQIEADEQLKECTLLFMDVNGFKKVNDTFGHHIGDEFLKQAAERIALDGLNTTKNQLEKCLSHFGELNDSAPEDIVLARYAGDEFVAILPGYIDEAEVRIISNQIIESFNRPFHCNNVQIASGISIGAATYPKDTYNPAELIKYADLAMYDAKRNKKGGFAQFKKFMHEEIEHRNWVEQALRIAIQEDQIFLQFQPKVNVVSGELSGVEALARWKHPEFGPISPEVFISVAEETGLIIPLGKKVIELALNQSKKWLDEGVYRKVAINIAPSQFGSKEFLTETLNLLKEYEVPGKLIELEITESMAMSKFGDTKKQLELLREAGISIGLDDFGTGFSNLSQLSSLPFDTLKIDRSLISEIGITQKNETILVAIIKMASNLGYETVAEGIEIEKQYRFLEQVKCDVIQGYFAGKPMMPEELDTWEENYAHPSRICEHEAIGSAA